MCGLIAAFALNNEKLAQDPARFAAARDTLTHRGPDEAGLWRSPSGRAMLGQRRLSIIDLSTGQQPLANETGKVKLVVNGEFYDYKRIRNELKQRGHHLRSTSDSEIALHLYEERGTGCLTDLRGEFAFVLWDEREQLLFAARDRFGIKPLYYTVHAGNLYLASEIKALLALGAPPLWDEEVFYRLSHFICHLGDPERTLFKGIYQLSPGSFLLAANGRLKFQSYWDIGYPRQEQPVLTGLSEAEIVAETRRLITEAVRIRLQADVPVCFYLSGGLDSSAVLGLAAASNIAKPIEAFTICFDAAHEADYDESAFAGETAARWGVTLHPVHITPQEVADNLAEAVWHVEAPFSNTNGVAKFLMARAVHRAGFKVALTGDGGDEVFAGYPGFVQDMILRRNGHNPPQTAAALAQLKQANPISQGLLVAHGDEGDLRSLERRLGFAPGWVRALASSGQRLQPFLREDFAAKFRGHNVYHQGFLNEFDPNQLVGREPLAVSLYTWNKTVLPYYILLYECDRVDMAHSVEARVPLLDHHLVEFVRNAPAELLIRGTTEKYLLKEAARPYLTETIYNRVKHPFYAPAIGLAPDGPMYQLTQDTLRSRAFADTFFDQRQAIELLDRLPHLGRTEITAFDPVVNLMLVTHLMQQMFGLSFG